MFSFGHRVRVHVHLLFFLMAFFIGWLNSGSILGTLLWMGVIFVSVLLHEYGHACTALFFGQQARIDLNGFGGLTQRQGKPLRLWQEFFVILNGPLVGFLCALLTFKLSQFVSEPYHSYFSLAYLLTIAYSVNLLWTFLNLLPIYPLDGGHLLGVILEGAFGFRGQRIALFVSLLTAGLLSLWLLLTQHLLAGSIFLLFAFESYRSWRQTLNITKEDYSASLQSLMQLAEKNKKQGDLQEAIDQFQQIRQSTKEGLLHIRASEELGSIFFTEGSFEDAYEMLMPLKKALSPEGLSLLHRTAYRLKKWKEALDLGELLYRLFPSAEMAVLNARAAAMLGKAPPALGWLQRAKKDGAKNLDEILAAPEFDAIRNQLQE